MAAPLGTLLGDSWSSFQRAFVTLLAGAVIFGLVLGMAQSVVGQRVVRQTKTTLEGVGIDLQQLQDMQQRIQAGDEAALEELLGAMPQFDDEQGERIARSMFTMYRSFLPMLSISMLLLWIISLIASAYFLLIALNDTVTIQDALVRAPRFIIPLFLLSLWIFVRTFMWIPVIGIITGIILGPRFILSPVLLVRDRTGVLESARVSYTRTRGFWGKIFGNAIVAIILLLVVQMIAGFVLDMLGMRELLSPIVQMLVTAFLTIFIVKLALTVEQHPQRA